MSVRNTNSIPPGFEYLCFNAKSDLLESLLHRDTSINDSQKIDSLLDEFAGELTLPHSIPPGIDDINLDPEGDIFFWMSLLSITLSRHRKNLILKILSSLSLHLISRSRITDSLMEEIDIFLDGDDSIPPDIPVDVPNILPTHPALQLDFDFIPSNDLGSDLELISVVCGFSLP
ncbi:hypothetical protein Tco_0844331 [Tanacetum coccineum]